jgi:hypothetical protein
MIPIASRSRAGHATLGPTPRTRKRTILRILGLADDAPEGRTRLAADTLRRHAILLASALASTGSTSERWPVPRFAREVARARRHLQPICSLDALAESYGRESFRLRASATAVHRASTLAGSPVEVAYALRWLELEGRLDHAPWPELLLRRTGHLPVA